MQITTGIVSGKPFLELEPSYIKRTMNVNALSHFWVNQCFLPKLLEENDGVIVTIASLMGMTGAVALSDYCASKFALIGMHESLRKEIRKGRHNVHMLLICPYAIATGMFGGIFEGS